MCLHVSIEWIKATLASGTPKQTVSEGTLPLPPRSQRHRQFGLADCRKGQHLD